MDLPHPHHTERSVKIDVLRGVAVIGMILAHALFFFHDTSNPFIASLESLLNTTVFTVFVFVFGMSLSKWLDVHAQDHGKRTWLLALKRAGIIYMAYAVTAVVAVLTSRDALADGIAILFGALTLANPPNFTEYMPLFVLLVLLVPVLRPLLRLTRGSLLLTFVIGAFSLLLGVTLHQLAVPNVLTGLKGLFSGDETLLRFPVLFYLPVMLWGLWWQYDSDHNAQDKTHTNRHVALTVAGVVLTVAGILVTRFFNIPILNPNIRWPPSVTFLTMGMSVAALGLLLMPSFSWTGRVVKQVIGYFGRDALDLWVNHLLLLFLYRQFIGIRLNSLLLILLFTLALTVLSVLLSSLIVTNRIRFPFHIAFTGTTRFRKRYIVYICIALLVLLWTSLVPSSPYGNFMLSPPLVAQRRLPSSVRAELAANQVWLLRNRPVPGSLELTLTLTDTPETVSLQPGSVRIEVNGQAEDFSGITASDGTLHFTKPVADMAPGVYTIGAVIDNGDNAIRSNPLTIYVSEPLYVAWTFDWEGWDAPDAALQAIEDMTLRFPTIKFSHFVSPRTFLPGVLTPQRSNKLAVFLNDRHTKGDELAMHLHMHFDLVEAAGVATRSSQHWGLRSEEGYDVPTTEYPPEEFRQIVQFAQAQASESGLPPMTGYRAGGWFLNTQQLNELSSLGYTYDSSGRDRPKTGAFRNTPWNLPLGAQPYYPSKEDQNLGGPDAGGLLEIPINGLSTYDQTVDMLKARVAHVYQGGILTTPRTLVFVSHPQFYSREFTKIPDVLTYIMSISQVTGLGPAVFVTTAEITDVWNTFNN